MSFFKPIKQRIKHSTKKIIKEIEKFKIYWNGGYTKIQPRVFGRGVLTMVHPSIIESEEDNCKEHFIPSLGSLKNSQVINSDNKHKVSVAKQNCCTEVETHHKEISICHIVPYEGKNPDHIYDVRFQRITPYTKLAVLRRQSTAPEFV